MTTSLKYPWGARNIPGTYHARFQWLVLWLRTISYPKLVDKLPDPSPMLLGRFVDSLFDDVSLNKVGKKASVG